MACTGNSLFPQITQLILFILAHFFLKPEMCMSLLIVKVFLDQIFLLGLNIFDFCL